MSTIKDRLSELVDAETARTGTSGEMSRYDEDTRKACIESFWTEATVNPKYKFDKPHLEFLELYHSDVEGNAIGWLHSLNTAGVVSNAHEDRNSALEHGASVMKLRKEYRAGIIDSSKK